MDNNRFYEQAVDLCDWTTALWYCAHAYSNQNSENDGVSEGVGSTAEMVSSVDEAGPEGGEGSYDNSRNDTNVWNMLPRSVLLTGENDVAVLTMAELYIQNEMFKQCSELLKNHEEVASHHIPDSEASYCLMVKSWLALNQSTKAERFVERILNVSVSHRKNIELRVAIEDSPTTSTLRPQSSHDRKNDDERVEPRSLVAGTNDSQNDEPPELLVALTCHQVPVSLISPNTVYLNLPQSSSCHPDHQEPRFWPRLLYWYLICIQRCSASINQESTLSERNPFFSEDDSGWNPDGTRILSDGYVKKFDMVKTLIEKREHQLDGGHSSNSREHSKGWNEDPTIDDHLFVLSELLMLSGQGMRANCGQYGFSLSPLFCHLTSLDRFKGSVHKFYLHSCIDRPSTSSGHVAPLIRAAQWRQGWSSSPPSHLQIAPLLARESNSISLLYTPLLLLSPHILTAPSGTSLSAMDSIMITHLHDAHCHTRPCSSSHQPLQDKIFLSSSSNSTVHLSVFDPLIPALVYWRSGVHHLYQKSIHAAQTDLTAALRLCPFLLHCWLHLVQAYHLGHRNEQATQACQVALGIAPNNTEASNLLISIINSTKNDNT